MNDLKTLKDIRKEVSYGNVSEMVVRKFKKEAIKWIKKLREKHKDNWSVGGKWNFKEFSYEVGGLTIGDEVEQSDVQPMIRILEHIFNISEEDIDES